MRFIDRSLVPPPPSLQDPNSQAARERVSAENYYKKTPPPVVAYKFKEYKADDIRHALTALFHGKCAYCESRYRGTQQMDVEHYRPKGVLAEEAHLGYWWLALNWENLLPSCIDCNRTRKLRIVEMAADGSIGFREVVAGKWDNFPIAAARRASSAEDDLALEEALLIDPTRENPDSHIRWIVRHIELPIAAPTFIEGVEDQRGRASIEFLALNREGLVEDRRSLLMEIALEFQGIRGILEFAVKMPAGAEREGVLQLGQKALVNLRRHEDADRPFSMLAQKFIRQELQALRDEFSSLLALVHV